MGVVLVWAITINAEENIQEKQLYYTDFSDWCDYEKSASTTETTVTWSTKYSKEELTFSIYDSQIGCTNFNTGKFPNWEGGFIMAAKSSDPYIVTSALASITTVTFMHGATGSNRGWALYAMGDGDDDWVLLSDAVATTATGTEVTVSVDRENVKLKFTNLNSSQNAYLMTLDIYGNVDMGSSPILGSFALNGTTYTAGDIFDEDGDGNMTATIQISKTETMVGESNPLTDIVAENGEVGEPSYAEEGDNVVVTIPVTYGESTIYYVLTVEYKPDYTVTYYDTDGETVVATQQVEQDAEIGQMADYSGTVEEGQIFRGWYASTEGGLKYGEDYVVTGDLSLYAIVNAIEVESTSGRYTFDLTDQYFYDEDHEAFNSVGSGKYYNNHGWVFSAGDQIELLVGGNAYIILYLCKYGNSNTISLLDTEGNAVDEVTTPIDTDGASTALRYTGEAGTITLTFSKGAYVHKVAIINVEESDIVQNEQGYFVVNAGDVDHLLSTLDMANAVASEEERTIVFLPNGTYDLGKTVLTPISGSNISIIGQSMEETIVVNAPDAEDEGIATTATFLITGTGTYLQDITLQNALDYYSSGSAGRAVVIQDKGTQTIAKNVKMLSYQDTYYSNNNSGQFYWETSEIHGCVDYICGGGDAYFNKCTLVNESRSASGNSGSATMTAPYTDGSDWGYVFESCTVENNASNFNYGRAWGGKPRLAYLNTILTEPSELTSTRFTLAGMNVAADKFVEYNTMDSEGNVVSPESNELTFTHSSGNNTMETILTEAEAAEYTLDNIFPEWAPDELAAQADFTETLSYEDGTLKWTAPDGAIAYAIFYDGELVEITGETSYTITESDESLYTVRAANSMGGFGNEASITEVTAIKNVEATAGDGQTSYYYNLQGQKVGSTEKGVLIKLTTGSDGKLTTQKIIQ